MEQSGKKKLFRCVYTPNSNNLRIFCVSEYKNIYNTHTYTNLKRIKKLQLFLIKQIQVTIFEMALLQLQI